MIIMRVSFPSLGPILIGHIKIIANITDGPTHNRFPGLNNFDLGMRFTKEGVYRPFLLYMDLSVL